MFKAGLTQSSRPLHPFSQPDGSDDRDLTPQCTFTPDPSPEEYHAKLRAELRIDCDEHSHVDPAVLAEFDTLFRTYPHAFLLPGEPLRRIHGSEHHNATSHHAGCHPLSSSRCIVKLMTFYDEISFNPQSLFGVLQRYLYAARIYTVNHNPPDLWPITDILDWLGGGKAFAKLDLANGYWQVPVLEGDREKAAVVTHCGILDYLSSSPCPSISGRPELPASSCKPHFLIS